MPLPPRLPAAKWRRRRFPKLVPPITSIGFVLIFHILLYQPSPLPACLQFCISHRHRQHVCNRVHCERANLAFWLFGRYCRHFNQSWLFENDLECPVQICHLKNKISYKRWICATDINAHMPKINFSLFHQIGSDEGAKWKEKQNKACFTFLNPPIQPFKVKISSFSFHAQSETCFNIFVLHLPLRSFTFVESISCCAWFELVSDLLFSGTRGMQEDMEKMEKTGGQRIPRWNLACKIHQKHKTLHYDPHDNHHYGDQ